MTRVPLFKVLNNSQRMQIVVEPQSIFLQAAIQRTFPGVAKRRVSDVMHLRKCLGQVRIESQRGRNLPRNLCDLDRMRQPAAKVIRCAACKNLCLSCEPAKRPRLNDTIPVTLE